MEVLLRDLRVALVSARRAPGFAATAVITLALGVGATTAVFSVVHGVLLRPLPYAGPDRLVRLWEEYPGGVSPAGNRWLSRSTYAVWRENARTLDALGGHALIESQVVLGGEVVKEFGARISPAVLATLGRSAGSWPISGRRRRSRGRACGGHRQRQVVARALRIECRRPRRLARHRWHGAHDCRRRAANVRVSGPACALLGALRDPEIADGADRRRSLHGACSTEAGRHAGAGRGRRHGNRACRAQAPAHRVLLRQRWSGRRPRPPARRRHDRRSASSAVDHGGGRRARAADGVCERCQPAAVPRRDAAARAGDPGRGRRKSRANRAPAVY